VVIGLLDALGKPDVPLMAVFVRLAAFVGGALGGLLGFSKGLGWVFRRHRARALALLSGFLIGSLRKLWPWKEKVELLYTHSNGREEWLEANLPWSQHPEPQLWAALGCAVIGSVLVTVLSKLGQRSGHA
jgi:putative membrane protein